MSLQFTETQGFLLSAAARRDDRFLTLPSNLKGGAAKRVAEKLVQAGLAREVRAKDGMPIWRRDSQSGQAFAFRLTAAGLKAATSQELATLAVSEEASSANGGNDRSRSCVASIGSSGEAARPRDGSKIARVLALLTRETGATIDEIIDATGWLSHTSRAALTGLRKRGFAIERRERPAGPRAYIIVASRHNAA
jgi:Protein of unknown function (DUF3489)